MYALWRGFVLWEERNAGVTLWGNIILFLTKLFMVYPKWVPWKSPTQISRHGFHRQHFTDNHFDRQRIYRKLLWPTTNLPNMNLTDNDFIFVVGQIRGRPKLLSVKSDERIWNRCQSNWLSVKVVVGQSNCRWNIVGKIYVRDFHGTYPKRGRRYWTSNTERL